MKNELIEILENLRRSNYIKSYKLNTFEERDTAYSTAKISLEVNGLKVVEKERRYNPNRKKFSVVSDMLLREVKQSLIELGIFGQLSKYNG